MNQNNVRVLVEGAGCPIVGSQIHWMKEAGYYIVQTDIDPLSVGLYLADKSYLVPPYKEEEEAFKVLREICEKERINLVIPNVDEGLPLWARRIEEWAAAGIHILISPYKSVVIFNDKLNTYEFLKQIHIPTPESSLRFSSHLQVVKPRYGRGSRGVTIYPGVPPEIIPEGYMYQQYVYGTEYTVDLLCYPAGSSLYAVCRQRMKTESGISFTGKVVHKPEIEHAASQIVSSASLFGPVNMQCIENETGFYFTDINPRTAGGQALSLKATENWYRLYPRMINRESLVPCPVQYGLMMMRFYDECYVIPEQLIK